MQSVPSNNPNRGPPTVMDSSKPREERDYKEIYPNLDEMEKLPVFVLHSDQEPIEDYVSRIRQSRINNVALNVARFREVDTDKFEQQSLKFDKVLSDYGFQEPNKKNSKRRKIYYTRPFQTEDNEKIEEVIAKKKKQVEYDMDEQDYLYLNHRNNQVSNTIKLIPEIFEIIMTLLENEWMDLENQMNSIGNDDESMGHLLTLDQGNNNEKYGNDDGIEFGIVDDQKCAVCNDSDCDNSNAIVFCDGCNIAVHQECYGVAFIPEGQWLCRKCMINRHRSFDCVFCPSKTGAFKQLDNSLWGHVICALWINELYFANPIYMEPIEGIDLIPKSRWKLNCYICKQKVGACIQCFNKNCFQAYHVTCAKRAGLFMEMTKGIQGAINNKLTLKSFCDRHTPDNYSNQKDIAEGINKTRSFFRNIKIINYQNDRLTKDKQLTNKLNIFKWKTENNTPIAPKRFSNIVFQKLDELKIERIDNTKKLNLLKDLGNVPNRNKSSYYEELEAISNDLCKYWCLKREFKNGAPLIRKNNNLILISSIIYGNNNLNEIQDKLNFSDVLIDDINKVIDLTRLNVDRQITTEGINNINGKIIETKLFSINKLITQILKTLTRIDNKSLLKNYKSKSSNLHLMTIIERNNNFQYKALQEFKGDITMLHGLIIKENKATNNIVKTSSKVMNYLDSNYTRYLRMEQDFYHTNDLDNIVSDSDLSDMESLTEDNEHQLKELVKVP